MEHRIGMAIVCLHVSAGLYLLCGLLLPFLLLADGDDTRLGLVLGVPLGLMCLAIAVGIEVAVHGLKRRKFWAWIVGLCIFGMYVPSCFLPLGALGLWGLLDVGSRKEFGIGVTPPRSRESA